MAAQRGWRTEQISRYYPALRRMLWRHFSAEEPWVLEWIRMPSDTSGRANSIWIRYVWTGKFLNPERKSCGFTNIRIPVDGALISNFPQSEIESKREEFKTLAVINKNFKLLKCERLTGFVVRFFVVKSDERQTNSLQLNSYRTHCSWTHAEL